MAWKTKHFKQVVGKLRLCKRFHAARQRILCSIVYQLMYATFFTAAVIASAECAVCAHYRLAGAPLTHFCVYFFSNLGFFVLKFH